MTKLVVVSHFETKQIVQFECMSSPQKVLTVQRPTITSRFRDLLVVEVEIVTHVRGTVYVVVLIEEYLQIVAKVVNQVLKELKLRFHQAISI